MVKKPMFSLLFKGVRIWLWTLRVKNTDLGIYMKHSFVTLEALAFNFYTANVNNVLRTIFWLLIFAIYKLQANTCSTTNLCFLCFAIDIPPLRKLLTPFSLDFTLSSRLNGTTRISHSTLFIEIPKFALNSAPSLKSKLFCTLSFNPEKFLKWSDKNKTNNTW